MLEIKFLLGQHTRNCLQQKMYFTIASGQQIWRLRSLILNVSRITH